MELHILEGLLAGFKIQARIQDLDLERMDFSRIREKHFKEQDREKANEILGSVSPVLEEQLEIESAFAIEEPTGIYYVIKHLGDGNYFAIDLAGRFFGMIHDPFEIELLFKNKEELTKSLESGAFSFDDYYKQRMNS